MRVGGERRVGTIGLSGARGEGKKPEIWSPVLRTLRERASRAEMRTMVLIIRTVLEGGKPSVRRDRELHGFGGKGDEGGVVPRSISRSGFDDMGQRSCRLYLL